MLAKPDLIVILDTLQALRELCKDCELHMRHITGATKLNFQIHFDLCIWAQLWVNGDGTVRYDFNNVRTNLYIGSVEVHDPKQAAEAIYTLLTSQ